MLLPSRRKHFREVKTSHTCTATGSKVGKNFEKAAQRVLLDPKTTEIVTNVLADFVSQGFTTLEDIQNLE